jgi:hypothetical protein
MTEPLWSRVVKDVGCLFVVVLAVGMGLWVVWSGG